MDQLETKSQDPGICHRLLISFLPIECPVCQASAFFTRLFNFTARAAPSLEGLLNHGLFIVRRIYAFIMQTLVAQVIKRVILGSPLEYGSTVVPDSYASQSENVIGTSNESTMDLAPHQDPSAEKDYQSMSDAKQAKEVDNSTRILTNSGLSCDFLGDDIEPSEVPLTVQEKGDEEKEQVKVPTPTVVQKARAPKKMVSINENVEIYPIFKNNRMMSKEWLSLNETRGEGTKPLKSILKVGSKLTNVNNE